MKVGDKITFLEEKRPYRIRACNERYAVCTKPLNLWQTVLYTIIDFQEEVRGPENLIFGLGAETDNQCQEMLDRIVKGESEISWRHRTKLNIKSSQ